MVLGQGEGGVGVDGEVIGSGGGAGQLGVVGEHGGRVGYGREGGRLDRGCERDRWAGGADCQRARQGTCHVGARRRAGPIFTSGSDVGQPVRQRVRDDDLVGGGRTGVGYEDLELDRLPDLPVAAVGLGDAQLGGAGNGDAALGRAGGPRRRRTYIGVVGLIARWRVG
jgi:hypothetical protein